MVMPAFLVFEASAYETYSGCASCHGDFRSSPYISLADGTDWGNDLHDIHRVNILSNDCNTCHTLNDGPVYIGSSNGGSGLSPISCVGCHGREEDMGNDSLSAGRGAGLRQHHAAAGQTSCQSCHSDANPSNYTPVGEDVLPEYFANSGINHPRMPIDSCNPGGGEDFAGASTGLDNDGDGIYDSADSDCTEVLPPFKINTGLSDAWYDPATDGQGFFITVLPDLGVVALAWFTYDTELPPEDATSNLGDPGNRWMTASGPYADNQAVLNIVLTSGGIFDTPGGVERTDPPGSDGTLVVTFESCNSGTVEYDIPSIDKQGTVPIQRVADDNIAICEALNTE
jgi:hypothetical protein